MNWGLVAAIGASMTAGVITFWLVMTMKIRAKDDPYLRHNKRKGRVKWDL